MTKRTAAITGVGYTEFTKKSGRTVLDLANEAATAAMADAGISASEVDGISSFMVMGDSVTSEAVATSLGLPALRYVMDFQQGGQSPSWLVQLAAMAVQQGYADNILVFRALNGRSGKRLSSGFSSGSGQYRVPVGYDAYMMYIAMWANRYLQEVGGSQEDLGAVAMAQRVYAQGNERAIQRDPLDWDAYLASPWVVEPFRMADCTSEIDGACAVLVSSLDRARDLAKPPVVIAGGSYATSARPGLDIGDQLLVDDYARNFTYQLRDDLYRQAGISASDVDFAELYDCFSSAVLMSMEGLGLCGLGEAGEIVRSGGTALNGRLPVNTHGGLLAEGYLHGMNTVTEAALQIRGDQGARQVPRHEVGVVTSGALNNGSALVLTVDR